MNFFFLLNNLHFSLEILGCLVFLMVAWLAYDAYLLRRDFLTASRGIGFLFLAVWQMLHAFNLASEVWAYAGYGFYFLGVIFILWNLVLEKPVLRPEFKAVLVLPGIAALSSYFNFFAAIGLALIAYFSYVQYKREFKKALRPFWMGFFFLALGAVFSVFYSEESLGALWLFGHIFELAGFAALAIWVWSYLALRIREELLLIFVSFALFISVIVTLTFSTILIGHIEAETESSLSTNTKVLDLAISGLKEEALAKVRLISTRADLKTAFAKNDFTNLEKIMGNILSDEKLGFLTLIDKDGQVVLRAHALSKQDDNLYSETVVKKALDEKKAFVAIESSPAEGFSIRAAAPLEGGGAVLAGFQLDSAFTDGIKRVTGLEMSVYNGDIRVATTILNPDQRGRSVGIRETNNKVLKAVLGEGSGVTLRTMILSRPFLASYLPLQDAGGRVIGMISAEKPQKEVLETAQSTDRATLVVVMAIMLLLIIPIYFITKRLSEEI